MKPLLPILLIAISASVIAAETRPSDIDMLRSKSIFSKDRHRSYTPTTRSSDSSPRTYGSRRPLLIGIATEGENSAALIELPGGKIVEVHLGEKLPEANATLVNATLDYIEISETGSPATRIVVGRDLGGGVVELPSATTTPAADAITGDDVVSRMRKRRMQETNR